MLAAFFGVLIVTIVVFFSVAILARVTLGQ
jgi:hypothetical protein